MTSEIAPTFTASYTYDANGNRLSKTLGGSTDNYTYDSGDKMLTAGAKSFVYDAAGRRTSMVVGGQTTSYSYDYEDRLTSVVVPGVGTNTFTYNGLDTRVGKVDSGGTKTFKRDGVGVTDPVLNDGAANYTPGLSERRGGVSKFTHSDRMGTNTKLTDATQATTDTKTYDAFGVATSATGSSPTPFGYAGDYGYHEDSDSGLKLLGHRYYDQSTGGFLTRDPEGDGRNWYAYARARPSGYIDPSGLYPLDQGRGGGNNPRSPEFDDWSDSDIQRRLGELKKSKLTPGEKQEKLKLQREQKGRGERNKKKRGKKNYYPPNPGLRVPTVELSPAAKNAAAATAGTTVAVVLYWVISEGLRVLFPPRNLIPIP
ncbi:MAG: RHS repeat-associated core domain-containing protein [Fimbriimonas ginsengisoli]|uniref:RHS repeat-associated core domain-containing protein n=1 Tax=Fimbriimonas ginsengisoli TaxID=1005039 RepID=A0A931LVU7_FIMGI|nr:RHS repeat-associated core domain-containing protein [Fimbriimonas ginsengisoli]